MMKIDDDIEELAYSILDEVSVPSMQYYVMGVRMIAEAIQAERDAALLRLRVYEEEDAVINRKFLDITDERCIHLEKVLTDLVGCYNEFQQSSGNMEEAYYKLAKYAYPQWQAAQAALNSESARA